MASRKVHVCVCVCVHMYCFNRVCMCVCNVCVRRCVQQRRTSKHAANVVKVKDVWTQLLENQAKRTVFLCVCVCVCVCVMYLLLL